MSTVEFSLIVILLGSGLWVGNKVDADGPQNHHVYNFGTPSGVRARRLGCSCGSDPRVRAQCCSGSGATWVLWKFRSGDQGSTAIWEPEPLGHRSNSDPGDEVSHIWTLGWWNTDSMRQQGLSTGVVQLSFYCGEYRATQWLHFEGWGFSEAGLLPGRQTLEVFGP